MEVNSFNFAPTPEIIFGAGVFPRLPELAARYGNKILFITGQSSFKKTGRREMLERMCAVSGLEFFFEECPSEPEPETVDFIAEQYRKSGISAVAAIGGGSVIDCGKAVSAMLVENGKTSEFLENVGSRIPSGAKVPFIAVPTTSGTGSEATKNAVFTKPGMLGYKNSLRHESFVPEIALIDPELTLQMPRKITAFSGIDALSQLIESYLSTKHGPVTDAMALSGIEAVSSSLLNLFEHSSDDIRLRSRMAYASLLSGITLANSGLIVVHGLAGTVGGFFSAPHGAVCGMLLAPSLEITLNRLTETGDSSGISRYADIFSAMTGKRLQNSHEAAEKLVELLYEWKTRLEIPSLSEIIKIDSDSTEYGDILARIAEKSGIKNNPVKLTNADMIEILRLCG